MLLYDLTLWQMAIYSVFEVKFHVVPNLKNICFHPVKCTHSIVDKVMPFSSPSGGTVYQKRIIQKEKKRKKI